MCEELHEVIAGTRRAYVSVGSVSLPAAHRCLLPGSFNPLHAGHLRMASVAESRLGQIVEFELSVTNVDKSTLDFAELSERLRQFVERTIWVTRAPTFLEKAALFPESTFVLGADTAIRLCHERYYQDECSPTQALRTLKELGCRFLVFGRCIDGQFVDATSLPIPDGFSELFRLVPEDDFRMDVSSRALRSDSKGAD